MSEIGQMNKDVRWRTAVAGAAFAVVAALALSPDSVVALLRDKEVREGLWSHALVPFFVVLALLLEAFEVGRHSKHRGAVNDAIVRMVVKRICTNAACPQIVDPNYSVREAAMAIFYREIDQPSREVAFYQWAWYYTARLWAALAALAGLIALGGALAAPRDEAALRWPAVAFLTLATGLSVLMSQYWAHKTLNHARMQVIQIQPRLGGRLDGAECPDPTCPAT